MMDALARARGTSPARDQSAGTIPRTWRKRATTFAAWISLLGVAATGCASDTYPHQSQHRPDTSQRLARAQALEEGLIGSRAVLAESDIVGFRCLVDSTPAEIRSVTTAAAAEGKTPTEIGSTQVWMALSSCSQLESSLIAKLVSPATGVDTVTIQLLVDKGSDILRTNGLW